MPQEINILGLTVDEARGLIKEILLECIQEMRRDPKDGAEVAMTVKEACKFLGVSPPTLRKYVRASLIRRHDLGAKKKVFYLSELREDLVKLEALGKTRPGC